MADIVIKQIEQLPSATQIRYKDMGDGTHSLVTATGSPIDSLSNAIIAVDFEHHELHEGDHFTYTETDGDLDAAAKMEILITTPNTAKWAHFVFIVDGQLATLVQLYETTTHVAGAGKTAYNNNRNNATANTTTLAANGGTGADGTLIFSDLFGIAAGGGVNRVTGGGSSRGGQEWILKQNTKYLLRVTSNTDNNVVTTKLSWYEHTSSN